MVKWPPSVPQWEWDYVDTADPTESSPAKEGETWFNTDTNEGYVYDGSTWVKTTVGEYTELGGTIPGTDIADDTVVARMIAADAITNTQIAENAVDTAEIAADAVTNALVAAGAIDTEQVATDAISNAEIAADAVDSEQIANAAVTAARIATNAVTATEIADNAVTESHLSFATATQSELDSHSGDTTNPHNVTDEQTGAAAARSTVGETGDHADLKNVSAADHVAVDHTVVIYDRDNPIKDFGTGSVTAPVRYEWFDTQLSVTLDLSNYDYLQFSVDNFGDSNSGYGPEEVRLKGDDTGEIIGYGDNPEGSGSSDVRDSTSAFEKTRTENFTIQMKTNVGTGYTGELMYDNMMLLSALQP